MMVCDGADYGHRLPRMPLNLFRNRPCVAGVDSSTQDAGHVDAAGRSRSAARQCRSCRHGAARRGFFPVLERTLETWDSPVGDRGPPDHRRIALCLVLAARERHLPCCAAWRGCACCGSASSAWGSGRCWFPGRSPIPTACRRPSSRPPTRSCGANRRLLYRHKLTRAVAIGTVLAVGGGLVAIVGDGGSIGEIRGGEVLMLGRRRPVDWYSIAAQRLLAGQSAARHHGAHHAALRPRAGGALSHPRRQRR